MRDRRVQSFRALPAHHRPSPVHRSLGRRRGRRPSARGRRPSARGRRSSARGRRSSRAGGVGRRRGGVGRRRGGVGRRRGGVGRRRGGVGRRRGGVGRRRGGVGSTRFRRFRHTTVRRKTGPVLPRLATQQGPIVGRPVITGRHVLLCNAADRLRAPPSQPIHEIVAAVVTPQKKDQSTGDHHRTHGDVRSAPSVSAETGATTRPTLRLRGRFSVRASGRCMSRTRGCIGVSRRYAFGTRTGCTGIRGESS